MNWGEHLKSEWLHIKRAPIAFLVAVILAAGVIWAAMEWAYRAQLNSASALNRDYEARLSGWGPEEAQKQVAELKEQVRRLSASYAPSLTSEQFEKLSARLSALPPRLVTVMYNGPESYGLGKSLDDAFRAANWPVRWPLAQALGGGAGLEIFITSDADLDLVRALKEPLGDSLKLATKHVPKEEGISIYVGFRAPIEN